MNEQGAEVLVRAALDGRRRGRGAYVTPDGVRCAIGFLAEAAGIVARGIHLGVLADGLEARARLDLAFGLRGGVLACPECSTEICGEHDLIVHANDVHQWDLLTIARKFGAPASAESDEAAS